MSKTLIAEMRKWSYWADKIAELVSETPHLASRKVVWLDDVETCIDEAEPHGREAHPVCKTCEHFKMTYPESLIGECGKYANYQGYDWYCPTHTALPSTGKTDD